MKEKQDIEEAADYLDALTAENEKKLISERAEISFLEKELKNISSIINSGGKQEESRNDKFFVPASAREDEKYMDKYRKLYESYTSGLEEHRKSYEELSRYADKIKFIHQFVKESIALNERAGQKAGEIGLQILETQEIERSRIARDLHDSTLQSLTSMVHRTELCTRLMDMDIIRARLELIGMTGFLKNIIDDMRNIIYDLRPMSLNDFGLGITIKSLLNKLSMEKQIQTELIIRPEEKNMPAVINITLYRLIQEACNNIIKHADAEKIMILMEYKEEDIIIEIQDDGKGFQENASNLENKNGYGLGLSIMKERVILLSGEFNIETMPGRGTKIKICIPIIK